jgi:hypothetical protein
MERTIDGGERDLAATPRQTAALTPVKQLPYGPDCTHDGRTHTALVIDARVR